jgi:hypothetical protein
MLATLGYHVHNDFYALNCILGDDFAKDGVTYENEPVTVLHKAKVASPANSCYVITSIENV